MDHLPLETLHQIFELACTDGGYTGCSLALTSRFIREATQGTRFHSLVLEAGTQRMVALVTLYQNLCSDPAGVRPRTCHLHLLLPLTAKPRPSGESTEEDEWDEESEDEDEEDSSGPLLAAQLLSIQQLLTLIADDLQSLVVTKHNLRAVYPIFTRPFPSLQDLTLVLRGDECTLTASDPTAKFQPTFPALTHLHLVAPPWSPALLPPWAAHAPRVTHLRISAHCLFGHFVDELPAALGTPQYPYRRGAGPGTVVGPPPAVRTYPSLARVVVQPGPRPASGPCGTNRFVFISKSGQLQRIEAGAKTAGVEMRVLPSCSWDEDEWDEAIRTEWLKRVGGEASRDWFSLEEDEDEDEDEDERKSEDSE